jgi:hypothetical protein
MMASFIVRADPHASAQTAQKNGGATDKSIVPTGQLSCTLMARKSGIVTVG